jgi:arsenite methyltransferase
MTNVVHPVDAGRLRHEVKAKYREVANDPTADFHFHTGRAHALRLGYPISPLDQLPKAACEAFAGVANPFHWDHPQPGEHVVDLGSGAGMDAFLAALWVGPTGRVIGVDVTPEMLTRSRRLADQLELEKRGVSRGCNRAVACGGRLGRLGDLQRGHNLCPDKVGVYREVHRILQPGGRMRIADICVQRPVPEGALRDIDLWTG